MEKRDENGNDILAWVILGYLCSHPDAKDTVAGIARWWLRGEGVQVEMIRVDGALEYLKRRGWLTTRGEGAAHRVYGLNKARQQGLQDFLQGRQSECSGIQGQDADLESVRASLPSA